MARATVVAAPVKSLARCSRAEDKLISPLLLVLGKSQTGSGKHYQETGPAVNQFSPEGMALPGRFTGLRGPAA